MSISKSDTVKKGRRPTARSKRRPAASSQRVPRVSLADRREQLIDATIQVMRRDGVRSVTMRAVAAEAKASLAAVHYCFDAKEALLEAAIRRWLKMMFTDSVQFPVDGGVRASVLQMVDSWWNWLEAAPDDVLAQFELALWAVRSEQTRPLAATIYPMYIDELEQMLSNSMARADETCGWGLERLSRAILAAIDGCSLQHLSDATSNARALCHLMVDLLLEQAEIARRGEVISAP